MDHRLCSLITDAQNHLNGRLREEAAKQQAAKEAAELDARVRNRETDRLCRTVAGVRSSMPVEIIDDPSDPRPQWTGESFYWRTRGGTRIDHPSAYSRHGWSNMVYCHSTRRVVVDLAWYARAAELLNRLPIGWRRIVCRLPELALLDAPVSTARGWVRIGRWQLRRSAGRVEISYTSAGPEADSAELARVSGQQELVRALVASCGDSVADALELVHADECGRLYRHGVAYLVRVVCPTTGSVYYLPVRSCSTARQAVASTFGVSADQYRPAVET